MARATVVGEMFGISFRSIDREGRPGSIGQLQWVHARKNEKELNETTTTMSWSCSQPWEVGELGKQVVVAAERQVQAAKRKGRHVHLQEHSRQAEVERR